MGGGLLPGLAALGLEGLNTADTGLNPTVVAGSQMAVTNKPGENQDITYTQTHKMTVPKDVIGCVIGKGGQKLEIMRLISGALICVDKEEDDADPDRVISITGSEDAVALAQYLVTMRLVD
ncbi:Poly(rC)-binding protein 3 [Homalodisca vitripennis]|nr:Poly(rC)-binding protein 3 [Homalodisca vitripennis]